MADEHPNRNGKSAVGGTVASVQIVSAPGAPVTETVFELTREADRQMRIKGPLPAVPRPA